MPKLQLAQSIRAYYPGVETLWSRSSNVQCAQKFHRGFCLLCNFSKMFGWLQVNLEHFKFVLWATFMNPQKACMCLLLERLNKSILLFTTEFGARRATWAERLTTQVPKSEGTIMTPFSSLISPPIVLTVTRGCIKVFQDSCSFLWHLWSVTRKTIDNTTKLRIFELSTNVTY